METGISGITKGINTENHGNFAFLESRFDKLKKRMGCSCSKINKGAVLEDEAEAGGSSYREKNEISNTAFVDSEQSDCYDVVSLLGLSNTD